MFIDKSYENTPIDALKEYVTAKKAEMKIARKLGYICEHALKTNNKQMQKQLENFVAQYVVFDTVSHSVKRLTPKGYLYAKTCKHIVRQFNVPQQYYENINSAYNKIKAHERYIARKTKPREKQ